MKAIIPESLDEALEHKKVYLNDAQFVAGGTDLVLKIRQNKVKPNALIRLKPEFSPKVRLIQGQIEVGATRTLTEVRNSEVIQENCAQLAEVARQIGSWQVQNIATLGGNIANASPAADSPPLLLVLGAKVELKSIDRQRQVALEDFLKGPGKIAIHPDECIFSIRFPVPDKRAFLKFWKFGARGANIISVANLAVYILADGKRISRCKMAVGGVAPTTKRLKKVEDLLNGVSLEDLTRSDFRHNVVEAVKASISPISDVRGSAWYKGRVVQRAVIYAIDQFLRAYSA